MNRVTVLLVDDDEDSYVLARSTLSDHIQTDYQIEWVSSADAALEMLIENRHDVCLLDYHLGEKTGLDVLREARAGLSHVPTILLTHHDNADLDWQAMEAGAVDFLGKDALSSPELERSIRYALENSRHLRQLEAQAVLLGAVIENIGDGVMISDAEGRVLQVNGAYARLTGYAPEELYGTISELYAPEVRRTLNTKGEWRQEIVGKKKNGMKFAERVVLRRVRDDRGQTTHFVSLHTDVTRQREREEHLHALAHHDALTGLPNRILFQDRLSQALFQALRRGQVVAVLYIDLDNFKPINDTFGHDVGDLVLKEAAKRLQACLRKEDTAARLGGDEFAIILASVEGKSGVTAVAEKILAAIGEPLQGPEGEPMEQRLGASIGASIFPDDSQYPAELLEQADEAMYVVKNRTKNGFAFFGDSSGSDQTST